MQSVLLLLPDGAIRPSLGGFTIDLSALVASTNPPTTGGDTPPGTTPPVIVPPVTVPPVAGDPPLPAGYTFYGAIAVPISGQKITTVDSGGANSGLRIKVPVPVYPWTVTSGFPPTPYVINSNPNHTGSIAIEQVPGGQVQPRVVAIRDRNGVVLVESKKEDGNNGPRINWTVNNPDHFSDLGAFFNIQGGDFFYIDLNNPYPNGNTAVLVDIAYPHRQ